MILLSNKSKVKSYLLLYGYWFSHTAQIENENLKTKMMKRIFLLLISSMLLFSCSKDEAVSTVGSIYGVVSDAVNGEPIRNVSVTLSPSNLTTATGSDGHYEFIDLPEGQYKVQCTSAKYQTNSRQITVSLGKVCRVIFSSLPLL